MNRIQESIFYLSEVYKVPYAVLAYVFGISKISVYRIKKRIRGDREEILKKIEEKISYYNTFNKEEFKEFEKNITKIY